MASAAARYFLPLFNRCPPMFCRLLARRGRGSGQRALSNAEIAFLSGLDRSTVSKLSALRTWNTVRASTIQSFSLACGVNLLRPSKQMAFFRRGKLDYLLKGPPAQKALLERLQSRLTRPAR